MYQYHIIHVRVERHAVIEELTAPVVICYCVVVSTHWFHEVRGSHLDPEPGYPEWNLSQFFPFTQGKLNIWWLPLSGTFPIQLTYIHAPICTTEGVPWKVCQVCGGYSLAYFEWKMLYQYGSESQPLHSYVINVFPLLFCPCFSPSFYSTHSIWVSDVQIVGLVIEVCLPGDPFHWTWHVLVSTCGGMWRMWCIRRSQIGGELLILHYG
jgi:hypothetical protein